MSSRSQSQLARLSWNSGRAEARAGLDHLVRHPVLGRLVVANVVYFFGTAARMSLLVVLVTTTVGGSALEFGVVLAVGAVGATVGSMTVGRVRERWAPRPLLVVSLAAQAVGMAAMAAAPSVWFIAVTSGLIGIPVGFQRPVAQAIQQRLAPEEMLGRVNVTSRMFTRGVIIVGALVAGLVADLGNVRMAFAVGAAVLAASAALMWRALGEVDSASRPAEQ